MRTYPRLWIGVAFVASLASGALRPAAAQAQDRDPTVVDGALRRPDGGSSGVDTVESAMGGPAGPVSTANIDTAMVISELSGVVRNNGIRWIWTVVVLVFFSLLDKGMLRAVRWVAAFVERRMPSRMPPQVYWRRLHLLSRIFLWIYAAIVLLKVIWGLSSQTLFALYGVLALVFGLGVGGFFFGLAKNAGERVWRNLQMPKGDPLFPQVDVVATQPRDIVTPAGGIQAPQAPAAPANRYAVVIGIDQYQDDRIRPLNCAGADARAFRDLLVDPQTCGIPEENTLLLLNEDASERAIRSAMGKWLPERAGPNDVAYVYFAGHGAPAVDPAGVKEDGLEKYLVPFDAVMDDLRSSAISMDTFRQYFDFIASKQLVFFMDSCYSGGVGGRTFQDPRYAGRSAILTDTFLEDLGGEGRLVISACDVNEVSIELLDVGHGLFTEYLIKGIAGGADANGDGTVSVDELYEYVYREVSERARALGARMNPIRKGSVRGSILLSKRAEAGPAQA